MRTSIVPPKLSVLTSMAYLFNLYACATQAEALQQRYDGKTVFEGANLVSIASVLTRVNNPFVQTSPLLIVIPFLYTHAILCLALTHCHPNWLCIAGIFGANKRWQEPNRRDINSAHAVVLGNICMQ